VTRTGENIAFEVLNVCREARPGISARRARFSAITFRDVANAMRTLGSLDDALNAMVDARKELDLRAGVAFTRFLTKHIQDRFSAALQQQQQQQQQQVYGRGTTSVAENLLVSVEVVQKLLLIRAHPKLLGLLDYLPVLKLHRLSVGSSNDPHDRRLVRQPDGMVI